MPAKRKRSVCLLAFNILPLISEKSQKKFIGGAELQQVNISRGLSKLGYDVSIVTVGPKNKRIINADGIKVITIKEIKNVKCKLLKKLLNIRSIWAALKSADAEIYYTRAASYVTALLYFYSKLNKKKYIYAGAHDTDFIPGEELIRNKRDKILYEFGLKRADKVIVQTQKQRDFLYKNYGINGAIIRNYLIDGAKNNNHQKELILWVSKFRKWKRPEMFLKLAVAFPNEKFVYIGAEDPSNPELYKKIKKETEALKNIDFLGFQPFNKTEKFFDHAKCLVNTSESEGFPNTYLQAWRRGIPVIATVDPDGIISRKSLGYVCHTIDDFKLSLKKLIYGKFNNTEQIIRYYNKNHSESNIYLYSSVLEKLIAKPKKR